MHGAQARSGTTVSFDKAVHMATRALYVVSPGAHSSGSQNCLGGLVTKTFVESGQKVLPKMDCAAAVSSPPLATLHWNPATRQSLSGGRNWTLPVSVSTVRNTGHDPQAGPLQINYGHRG